MSSGPLQFWYRLQCLSFRISDERGRSIVENVELIFCWSHRRAQNKVIDLAIRTDVVAAFLKRYNLDLVCRAHQVVEDGQTLHACCPRNGWSMKRCRSMIGRDHFGSKCIKKLGARYEFFGKRQLARILGSHGPWTNHHGDHMQPYATLNPVLRKVRER